MKIQFFLRINRYAPVVIEVFKKYLNQVPPGGLAL